MYTADATRREFTGFRSPNFTMVPDEVFDELLTELSGAELKVLLYIIRRTSGFKRDSDNISQSQMLHGIRTSDGRVLDHGAGVTKKTLLAALDGLEARNIIIRCRRQSMAKGNEATNYRLNVLWVARQGDGCEQVSPQIVANGELELEGSSTARFGDRVRQGGAAEARLPMVQQLPQGLGEKSTPGVGATITPYKRQAGQTVSQDTEQQHSQANLVSQVREDVVVALTQLGVSRKVARDLAALYSLEMIQAQIDMLAYRKAEDPAAVLVKAIREEWAPPGGYETPQQREEHAEQDIEEQAECASIVEESRRHRQSWSQRMIDQHKIDRTTLDLWGRAQGQLPLFIGAHAYQQHFAHSLLQPPGRAHATVLVPNAFQKAQLRPEYHEALEQVLHCALGRKVRVEVRYAP